ncbi:hypothetical protein CLW00_104223 [Mongoliibacter ruber]|uniref:Uncharacterized protein n=1 Tax=Mongoliibacter ruber TaxID=1750599 RepID=A0A2T0WPF8_9BACT|nr:hypothetical protein CLW00_104223 [Mongoliibacter ruber]
MRDKKVGGLWNAGVLIHELRFMRGKSERSLIGLGIGI